MTCVTTTRAVAASIFDVGSDGTSAPLLAGTGSYSFINADIRNTLYAGFSVLADGGTSEADNFVVPGSVPVPEPGSMVLVGLSLGLLGMIRLKKPA